MANPGITSDKEKRKKQRHEERDAKERAVAAEWVLSEERWEKEKEKL